MSETLQRLTEQKVAAEPKWPDLDGGLPRLDGIVSLPRNAPPAAPNGFQNPRINEHGHANDRATYDSGRGDDGNRVANPLILEDQQREQLAFRGEYLGGPMLASETPDVESSASLSPILLSATTVCQDM